MSKTSTWIKKMVGGFALSTAVLTNAQAAEPTEVNMCIFDPIGASGPLYQALEDYRAAALSWGAKLKLHTYTDERVASDEFKAGVCDLVNLTGVRARNFNSFTGTIDSIGSIPSYKHMRMVLDTLATPKAAKYMRQGDYEIVSIVPGGAVFPFVNDKSIDSPEKLAGKKIAVLDSAPEMQYLVQQVGMTPVGATISNIFSKWNNHSVDIAGAPAVVYEPMELYKGVEPNGGIIDWPLAQVTVQVVARWSKLPEGFGQKSREYAQGQFETAMSTILASEDRIPKKYWMSVPNELKDTWTETFRQNRIALREKSIYDGKALTLFRKIRCNVEPDAAECSATDKE